MTSLYEHAGGREGLRHFIGIFYSSVLADPVLRPLFGAGRPEHVDQLTAFDAESFGGPDDFTRSMGGFSHLIDVHRGLKITEEQRRRFVGCTWLPPMPPGSPMTRRSGRRCDRTLNSARA
jgi:hemoglobin